MRLSPGHLALHSPCTKAPVLCARGNPQRFLFALVVSASCRLTALRLPITRTSNLQEERHSYSALARWDQAAHPAWLPCWLASLPDKCSSPCWVRAPDGSGLCGGGAYAGAGLSALTGLSREPGRCPWASLTFPSCQPSLLQAHSRCGDGCRVARGARTHNRISAVTNRPWTQ